MTDHEPTGAPEVDLGGGAAEDVAAVIQSAKARGGVDSLRDYVATTLPGAEDGDPEKVADVASVALEIIDAIPLMLASAHREAEDRGMAEVVLPLLERAERYFLVPIDLIPEMTHGLPGLLDDAYLVLRTLENLESGPEPFLDWDLDVSLEFLEGLLGRSMTGRLDEIAADAVADLQEHLQAAWDRAEHRA